MPKVTVITPNYNYARYLPQRLDSILAQTYRDFELIIVDNASTDNSREVIESYAKDPRVTGDLQRAEQRQHVQTMAFGVKPSER